MLYVILKIGNLTEDLVTARKLPKLLVNLCTVSLFSSTFYRPFIFCPSKGRAQTLKKVTKTHNFVYFLLSKIFDFGKRMFSNKASIVRIHFREQPKCPKRVEH